MSESKKELLFYQSDEIPHDSGRLAFNIMLLEGLGNLFPWNAFITASSYFFARFCGTLFQNNFENFFSLSFTFCQTIGLGVSVIYANKLSYHSRIVYPLALYALIFAFTTILVLFIVPAGLLFWLTLICMCLCGLLAASLTSGIFSLAALFPPEHTGAIMIGQGLAGLTTSVANIITILSAPSTTVCNDDNNNTTASDDDGDCENSIDFGAFAYFFIATIVLVSCIVGYIILQRLPFTKYYIDKENSENDDHAHNNDHNRSHSQSRNISSGTGGSKRKKEFIDISTSKSSNIDLNRSLLQKEVENPIYESYSEDRQQLEDQDRDHGRNHNQENYCLHQQHGIENELILEVDKLSETIDENKIDWNRILRIFLELKSASIAVWFTFTVTICIFPGIIVLIQSTHYCISSNQFYNDLFVPYLFLIFNLFDFCGRYCAGTLRLQLNKNTILTASVARVIFLPAFMFCNIVDSRLPIAFNNDSCPILFMILLAFSNGFVASAGMITGPTLVSSQDSSLAGAIMAFSLTFGLLCGACLSFIVVYIVRRKSF